MIELFHVHITNATFYFSLLFSNQFLEFCSKQLGHFCWFQLYLVALNLKYWFHFQDILWFPISLSISSETQVFWEELVVCLYLHHLIIMEWCFSFCRDLLSVVIMATFIQFLETNCIFHQLFKNYQYQTIMSLRTDEVICFLYVILKF